MNEIEVKCECDFDQAALDTAAQELRDSLGGDCDACQGNGYVPKNVLVDTDCLACNGTGIKSSDPDYIPGYDDGEAEPSDDEISLQ